MNLGFSYIGFLFLIMLFVPNAFWVKNKPKCYEWYAKDENKALLFLERAGEVLVTCFLLIFRDFNVHELRPWSIWMIGAFALMILYEIFWIRYFKSEKTMKDFYSSILDIPVAGATLPVVAILLLSIYGKNPLLLVAGIVLGIGHIGIHLQHKHEIERTAE